MRDLTTSREQNSVYLLAIKERSPCVLLKPGRMMFAWDRMRSLGVDHR